MSPAQTCHPRPKTSSIVYSFGVGAKINTAMERNAGKPPRGFETANLCGLVNLVSQVSPAPLGQLSQGDMSGAVFSGFLPGPSIPLSDDRGSRQRGQLPAGGSPNPHPPGVLPRNHVSLAGSATAGAGTGREVQLPLLFSPGIDR